MPQKWKIEISFTHDHDWNYWWGMRVMLNALNTAWGLDAGLVYEEMNEGINIWITVDMTGRMGPGPDIVHAFSHLGNVTREN